MAIDTKISDRDNIFFDLFGVLHHFQHCTGHISMGSWKGRGNQYIQLYVLYSPRGEKQVIKITKNSTSLALLLFFSTIVSNKLKHQTKSSTPKSITLHCNMTTSKHTDKRCVQHNMATKSFSFDSESIMYIHIISTKPGIKFLFTKFLSKYLKPEIKL